MVFPPGWPENCPPRAAAAPSSAYYRVVKTNPPSPDDFKSYSESGTVRKGGDLCKRCGLSIFDNWEGANAARLNFPALGEHIACGNLNAVHGKIMQTGANPHHCTWWPYDGLDRLSLFEVILEP